MSNHIHLIARTENEKGLSALVGDFKKFTSKQIIKSIQANKEESRKEWMLRLFKYYAKFNGNNSEYQFWIQDNHPIELVTPKWINQKLDYIHLNPVRAGSVEEPEHYLYSSAKNYVGMDGVLEVHILDLRNDIGYIDLG